MMRVSCTPGRQLPAGLGASLDHHLLGDVNDSHLGPQESDLLFRDLERALAEHAAREHVLPKLPDCLSALALGAERL